ncbi:hypothetical protein ACN47E_007937 [Coniothyrium glycines]
MSDHTRPRHSRDSQPASRASLRDGSPIPSSDGESYYYDPSYSVSPALNIDRRTPTPTPAPSAPESRLDSIAGPANNQATLDGSICNDASSSVDDDQFVPDAVLNRGDLDKLGTSAKPSRDKLLGSLEPGISAVGITCRRMTKVRDPVAEDCAPGGRAQGRSSESTQSPRASPNSGQRSINHTNSLESDPLDKDSRQGVPRVTLSTLPRENLVDLLQKWWPLELIHGSRPPLSPSSEQVLVNQALKFRSFTNFERRAESRARNRRGEVSDIDATSTTAIFKNNTGATLDNPSELILRLWTDIQELDGNLAMRRFCDTIEEALLAEETQEDRDRNQSALVTVQTFFRLLDTGAMNNLNDFNIDTVGVDLEKLFQAVKLVVRDDPDTPSTLVTPNRFRSDQRRDFSGSTIFLFTDQSSIMPHSNIATVTDDDHLDRNEPTSSPPKDNIETSIPHQELTSQSQNPVLSIEGPRYERTKMMLFRPHRRPLTSSDNLV